MKVFSVTALAALLFSSSVVLADGDCPPDVTLASGRLIGNTTSLPVATVTVNKYLGIPFAASPQRFSPPTKAPR
jgi:hypothetical protein